MAISDYYLTPDIGTSKDAMKRKMAYALLMQATSGEPIKSWTQAAARMMQGAIGGYGLYSADQGDREREAAVSGAINNLPGMSPVAPGPTSDATPTGAPRIAAAMAPPPPYGNNVVPTDAGGSIPMPPANPLGGLNPNFRNNFADLRTAAANQGVDFNAPEAGSLGNVRTPEQQAALYAQGRTAPGPIVTGTLNSNHLTGNALDVVPQNGATPDMVGKTVQALIAGDPRFAGMRSGATFSNLYDPLHVEQRNTQLAGPVPSPDTSPVQPSVQPSIQPSIQAPTQQIRPPVLTPQQAGEIRTLWSDPATRPLALQKYQEYSKPKEQIVPLITPQDRAAAGIPPGDNSPYTRNSVTGEIKSINNRPQVNVNNQAESSFEKTYGESMAKRATSVIDAGDKAAADLQKVQLLRGLLNDIGTGKIVPAAMSMGAWMQSVGLDPKLIGVDANKPASAEAATSIMNRFALSNIGAQEGGIPANNFSEADRDFILKLVPNLRNRPEANDIILTAKEREAQLAMKRADEWAQARQNGVSYEKFEAQWRKSMPKDIFADLRVQANALKAGSPSAPQAPSIDDLVKKYSQ